MGANFDHIDKDKGEQVELFQLEPFQIYSVVIPTFLDGIKSEALLADN